MAALALTYEDYIALNGGEEKCGICGALRPPNRKLDRDHEHRGDGSKAARGLLCRRCNRWLKVYLKLPWLRLAVAYLERHEERNAERTPAR